MEKIRTKDFQNLVGRAGRAGMHTEGTIIFSDPKLFDERNEDKHKQRWTDANDLLNPSNSEVTESSLLKVLSSFTSNYKNYILDTNVASLLQEALKDRTKVLELLTSAAEAHKRFKFTPESLHSQLHSKLELLEALESYLMSHRGGESFATFLVATEELAKETLAYSLADVEHKQHLVDLFKYIAQHIQNRRCASHPRVGSH